MPPPGGFKGGIPPPPPPPGAGGLEVMKLTNKQRLRLRQLHWEKLNTNDASRTVWGRVSMDASLDLKELEGLFTLQESTLGEKKLDQKKKRVINIIDLKRSHNISIQLSGIRAPFGEIKEAVLNMDDDKLSIEALQALINAVPTKDEREKIEKFVATAPQEDIERLGVVEKFFLEMMPIPRLQQRLEGFIFKAMYESNLGRVKRELQMLDTACSDLKNSELFVKVLENVLHAGNYLNGGTFRGQASGFKLATLLRLKDVKGTDRKTSLLHFVIFSLLRTDGEFSTLPAVLKAVGPASHIHLDSLRLTLADMDRGLKTINDEILKASVVTDDGAEGELHDRFRDVMVTFSERADDELQRLHESAHETLSRLKDLAQYYGEEFTDNNPTDIFRTVREFLHIYEKAVKEISDKKKADDAAKKAAAEGAARGRGKSKRAMSGDDTEGEEGLRAGSAGLRKVSPSKRESRPMGRVMTEEEATSVSRGNSLDHGPSWAATSSAPTSAGPGSPSESVGSVPQPPRLPGSPGEASASGEGGAPAGGDGSAAPSRSASAVSVASGDGPAADLYSAGAVPPLAAAGAGGGGGEGSGLSGYEAGEDLGGASGQSSGIAASACLSLATDNSQGSDDAQGEVSSFAAPASGDGSPSPGGEQHATPADDDARGGRPPSHAASSDGRSAPAPSTAAELFRKVGGKSEGGGAAPGASAEAMPEEITEEIEEYEDDFEVAEAGGGEELEGAAPPSFGRRAAGSAGSGPSAAGGAEGAAASERKAAPMVPVLQLSRLPRRKDVSHKYSMSEEELGVDSDGEGSIDGSPF